MHLKEIEEKLNRLYHLQNVLRLNLSDIADQIEDLEVKQSMLETEQLERQTNHDRI